MMSIGDIFYMIAIVLFSFMTFLIIRGNFQRKFNDNGERLDLIEKEEKEQQNKEKEA
jgi:uncharacterized ion transporter superfamily protein YfcC